MLEIIDMKKIGFGYEKSNPIKVFGAGASYNYLDRLKHTEGTIVKWERHGSVLGITNDKILDEYFVYVLLNNSTKELRRYTMYIDMYWLGLSDDCPEDFELISY